MISNIHTHHVHHPQLNMLPLFSLSWRGIGTLASSSPKASKGVKKSKKDDEDKIELSYQQKLKLHYEAEEAKALFSAATREKVTYYTSVINAVALPLTIFRPNKPCDLALSLSIPIHAHVGLTHVIEDYTPNPKLRWLFKKMLLGTTAASLVCSVHFCHKNIGFGRAIRKFWEI